MYSHLIFQNALESEPVFKKGNKMSRATWSKEDVKHLSKIGKNFIEGKPITQDAIDDVFGTSYLLQKFTFAQIRTRIIHYTKIIVSRIHYYYLNNLR